MFSNNLKVLRYPSQRRKNEILERKKKKNVPINTEKTIKQQIIEI
jgi:hypothetical protein